MVSSNTVRHGEISTLVDLLRWRAQHQARQSAYIFMTEGVETAHLTYEVLDYQARVIGGLLQSLVETGSRVLLLYPPGLEYIAAFFGCLYAGAIAIPSYPPRLNRPDARLQGIVNDSQARIALTLPAIRSGIERRFDHTPELAAVRWEVTDQLTEAWGAQWHAPAIASDTLAFLQYTSGSTSTPKGVMVTHGNILHNERMIQQAFEHNEESTIAGWLPIYHDMGLIGNVLQPLYLGTPCYLMSPTEFLHTPYNWLKLISDSRAHTSGGPNFAYDLCVQKVTPEQRQTLDLSRWQVAFNGSEPVRTQTLERFCETFAPCGFRPEAFYPCYGLAEATLFVTGRIRSAMPVSYAAVQASALAQNQVKDASYRKAHGEEENSALGRSLPASAVNSSDEVRDVRTLVSSGGCWLDEEITIVNPETLARCAPDEVGEIWIAGPHVAQGYWERPEVSLDVFGARLAGTGAGPYLRTGDLGFLKAGELFITGRRKDLIILRGRNHYPQDIELTVEQAHPALQSSGGAAFSVEVEGEEQLVVVCEVQRTSRNVDVDEVTRAVRQAVSEAHELQAHAVVVLRPMSVPKTSSGKIQRHLARARFLDDSLEVIGSSILSAAPTAAEPETITIEELSALSSEQRLGRLETYLSAQVCRVLHAHSVGRQQPLVTLGIDSLMSIELQNTLAAQLGVNIPAVDFLEGISVAQLAGRILDRIDSRRGRSIPEMAIQPQALGRVWPLSFEQERIWFLDQLTPGNPAYHIPYAMRLRGSLDYGSLERSINEIIRRHAILRATFQMDKRDIHQTIMPNLTLAIAPADLRSLPGPEREAQFRAQMAEIIQRPFELAKGPLLRAALFCLDDEEHVLVLVLHHIISDITSLALLLRELAALYNAFTTRQAAPLSELSIQYGDFAHWQRQNITPDSLAGHLAYWKEQLDGAQQKPWLPTDRPRPAVPTTQSAQYHFALSANLAASLRALSRQEGATPFAALLAAFYALLRRYSGQADLCVGVPTLGRWYPEIQGLIGFFAYPLALRMDVSGELTFRQLLEQVRAMLHGSYAHQAVPFAQVVQAVWARRGRNSAPLFPAMFSLVKTPLEGVAIPGLIMERVRIDDAATDFDWFLTLVEEEDGKLCGQWGYNPGLFAADTIATLAKAFEDLLAECIQKPDTTLSQLTWPSALAPQANKERLQQGSPTTPSSVDIVGCASRNQEISDSRFFKTASTSVAASTLVTASTSVTASTPVAASTPVTASTLAIAASFTAEPLAEALDFWIKKLTLPLRIEFAPYHQVFQQLLDPASLLRENERGANLILLRFEDWLHFDEQFHVEDGLSTANLAVLKQNLDEFVAALKTAASRSKVPYFVLVCPPSSNLLGDINYVSFSKHWERSQEELEPISGVYIISSEDVLARYPVEQYADPQANKLGHIPYTKAFFTALGTMAIRQFHVLQRPPYKVIVLDCDQTLWNGVCGEDGWQGIEVTPQHRVLQEFMIAQHEAGMLLCLCSKNNEADVWAVFERQPRMALKKEHLVSWRINWLPKYENIRSLANELGLGLDSFIFVDDNPVECAEMRIHCPQVATVQLPEAVERIPKFLNNVWVFDHLKITDADRNRSEQYRQNAERERLRQNAPTLDDFLASLDLHVEIAEMMPEQVERVAQLTQRTNQFNTTTIRRSPHELVALQKSDGMGCLTVKVRDRFGDYGLVGALMLERCSEQVRVDTLLLSCRVLGRKVEHRLLEALGRVAQAHGLQQVEIPYCPTQKNQPVLDFLNAVGEEFRCASNGGYSFRFPVERLLNMSGDAGEGKKP